MDFTQQNRELIAVVMISAGIGAAVAGIIVALAVSR